MHSRKLTKIHKTCKFCKIKFGLQTFSLEEKLKQNDFNYTHI